MSEDETTIDVADGAWDKTDFGALPGAKDWASAAPARAFLKRVEYQIGIADKALAELRCSHCNRVNEGQERSVEFWKGFKRAFEACRNVLMDAQTAAAVAGQPFVPVLEIERPLEGGQQ